MVPHTAQCCRTKAPGPDLGGGRGPGPQAPHQQRAPHQTPRKKKQKKIKRKKNKTEHYLTDHSDVIFKVSNAQKSKFSGAPPQTPWGPYLHSVVKVRGSSVGLTPPLLHRLDPSPRPPPLLESEPGLPNAGPLLLSSIKSRKNCGCMVKVMLSITKMLSTCRLH